MEAVEDAEDTLQSSALEDILHRQADILCLQNLSSSSPWREKLSTAGFASLWRQRTQSKAYLPLYGKPNCLQKKPVPVVPIGGD